jgi:hypothetical protein
MMFDRLNHGGEKYAQDSTVNERESHVGQECVDVKEKGGRKMKFQELEVK